MDLHKVLCPQQFFEHGEREHIGGNRILCTVLGQRLHFALHEGAHVYTRGRLDERKGPTAAAIVEGCLSSLAPDLFALTSFSRLGDRR